VSSLPSNLAPELIRPEQHIENDFEVVAGDGVAVEVEGAGRFEGAVELQEARGHHDYVGHHL
jgi:hypothetical protein